MKQLSTAKAQNVQNTKYVTIDSHVVAIGDSEVGCVVGGISFDALGSLQSGDSGTGARGDYDNVGRRGGRGGRAL